MKVRLSATSPPAVPMLSWVALLSEADRQAELARRHRSGTTFAARLDGDPQELLHALSKQTAVRHFEETKPSLHDIFIRIAGPEAMEATTVGSEGGSI